MPGGLVFNKTVTFDATGRALVEFFSPRTSRKTFLKRVYVQPFTTDITVSADDGQNSIPVKFAVGNPPWKMEGVIYRLLLTGVNGSTVAVSGEMAA